MKLDTSYLELLLQKAKYEEGLGVGLLPIANTTIGEEKIVLLEAKAEKGGEIKPHVHQHGGEICVPLTRGTVQFGRPQKDSEGNFKTEGDEVVTDWDVTARDLEPGRPVEVPEGVAHHFAALGDEPLILLFVVPEGHAAATDRLYCTHP